MSKEASKHAKNAAVKEKARELTNKQMDEITELKEMLKNQSFFNKITRHC